jgi:hypothetical protein
MLKCRGEQIKKETQTKQLIDQLPPQGGWSTGATYFLSFSEIIVLQVFVLFWCIFRLIFTVVLLLCGPYGLCLRPLTG